MKIRSSLGILIGMALTGSVGLLLLLLGCALPPFSNWWPMFVVCFYILGPFPLAIARRLDRHDVFSSDSNHVAYEIAYFVSSFIVVSAFD
ncbi:leptin receptor gene-related protein-like isoform X2 [Dysidea avara]|uniref:leptin receptor gene-related protein-like isoform X2 n=1 Tax=Dysidea avara TaxID=196820 RepID=UPI0033274606